MKSTDSCAKTTWLTSSRLVLLGRYQTTLDARRRHFLEATTVIAKCATRLADGDSTPRTRCGCAGVSTTSFSRFNRPNRTLFSRTTMACISWGYRDNLGRSAPLLLFNGAPVCHAARRQADARWRKQEWMRRNASMSRESSEWGVPRRCNLRVFTTAGIAPNKCPAVG